MVDRFIATGEMFTVTKRANLHTEYFYSKVDRFIATGEIFTVTKRVNLHTEYFYSKKFSKIGSRKKRLLMTSNLTFGLACRNEGA